MMIIAIANISTMPIFLMFNEKSKKGIDTIIKGNVSRLIISTYYNLVERIIQSFNNNEYLMSIGLIHHYGTDKEMSYQICHNILTKVLRLKPQHEYIVNKYKSNFVNKYVIGMHIRTGYGDFRDSERFIVRGQEKDFIEYGKSYSMNHENVIWFICSDSTRVKERIIKAVNNSGIKILDYNHKILSHTGQVLDFDEELRCIIEMRLLGYSNNLILTENSTFSENAFYLSPISFNNEKDKYTIISKTHSLNYEDLVNNTINYLNIQISETANILENNRKDIDIEWDQDEYEHTIQYDPKYKNIEGMLNHKHILQIFPNITSMNVDIIFVIFCFPNELTDRMVIRSIMKEMNNIIGNYSMNYYFVSGTQVKFPHTYPLEYLKRESLEYNDMIVFNHHPKSYYNLLKSFLLYQYLIKSFNPFQYLIRIDTNIYFSPFELYKLINDLCDFAGNYMFHVMKYEMMKEILKERKVISHYFGNEDGFYDYIKKRYKYLFCTFSNENEYNYHGRNISDIKDLNHIIDLYLPNSLIKYFLMKKGVFKS